MILRALPALLIFFGIGSATYDPETGFAIGIFGPITEFSQDDLAAAVLFDLDLRKYRDPDLRQRLGPPILDIPNLHPDLKIRVMVGTSHGQSTIGVATALDWLYGQNGTQKVVGIVGGAYSSISMSVASVCDVFNTPQISFGATSRSLSDKTMYPWFLRTIAPNSFQGQAMWAWMNVAGVPSVVFFYRSLEAYGEGLFQVAFDQAFAANQPRRVSGIGIDLSGEMEGDRMAMIPRVLDIKAMGTKFIVIAFSSTINVALAMYAMEQQEMLYSDYQILGADGLALPDSSPYLPSRGYPQGCMRFAPVAAGERFPLFENTWHNMTPDDLYSPEARSRYMLDRFRSPLDDAPTPKLVASDFTDGLPFFYSNFLVDAAFGFVVAINNLLNAGVSPAKIYGEQLLTELRSISFEGVTGHVAFDENADRIADWELGNVKVEGGIMQSVAVWESASTSLLESITFHDPNNEALTWITGDVSLKAPKALTACALGQRWDTSAGLCIFCDVNEGAVQDESGDPSCTSCGPGSVSIQPLGALSCEKCPAGTFRDSTLVNCTPCAAGSFADEPGRSACDACDSGQYVATEGATACDACGGDQSSTFTTLERTLDSSGQRALSLKFGADSASFCGCRPHFREDSFGGCVACAEGMICQGLNETTIASGYYADFVSPQGELSVFKCFGESERCAGGLPGHTCAPGRQGLTCSECEDGKTPKSGGSCVDCEGSDLGPFVAAICAGFAALLLAYYLVDTQNRVTQSHALLLAACAAGQLVTVTQQLGVVGKLSTSWEEPIKSFMNVVQLLALNLEVLRLNCVGSVSPLQRFSIKLTLIFVTIAFMLVIHAASVSLRHKCRWRKQIYSLIGSVGMLFMVFNIAVTSAVLEPFQCEQHPNDKWTMRPSPGVLCWDSDDDHRFMVLGGALAFILVPLAFMVTCYIVVKQFPKRMQAGDAEFLKAFAFLFFRFRASRHWYAFYQIIRNFGVAMVLVIPDVSTQVLVLAMILLVGFGMSLYLWPWRVDYANALDCLFGGCSLMVVCMSGLFLDSDQKNLAGTSWMILIFVCICLFGGPLAITYGLCKRYLRWKKPFQFFLCHHKSGSGAYVRLLKMHLRESSHLKSGVFVDSDNLDNLDHLFDHVGMDTENLVVICSELIFTRPWCVGEMCVARLKGVNVTLVALPHHVLPDEVFISDLSNRISDLEVLIESGISDEMIAETLRWIEENPTINVPEAVTPLIMDMVASKLFLRESATIEEGSRHSKSMDGKSGHEAGQSLMLFDHTNMEAAATALIIRKLLTPHLTHNTKKIPELILEDSRGSHVASDVCGPVLVVCTRGIFETTQVMRFFVRTSRLAVTFLPLICEQNFSVPRRDIAMTFRRSGSAAAFDEKEISTLASVITVVFREIAVHFDAQYSSLTILDVAAKSVARRLLEDKTLSNSMGPVGSILAQKGVPAGKAAAAGASHGPAPDVITEAPPSAGSHKEANSSTDVLRYMGDAPPMAMPMVTIEDITRPGFRYELAM